MLYCVLKSRFLITADISNPSIYSRQLQRMRPDDDANRDGNPNSNTDLHKLQPHDPSCGDGHEIPMSKLWRDNDLERPEVSEVRPSLQVPKMRFCWTVSTWHTSLLASRYFQQQLM